ncbi:MAG: hypothetical protein QF535_18250, partial [Anaerolineales bacterium]|nr:hypothetical protein [Anaerolineales bacterium]
ETEDTTYNFTIEVTDPQNQSVSRAYSFIVLSFQIGNSMRFNDNDTPYLSRTPGSAGNRKTWTISCWVKRTSPGVSGYFFGATNSGVDAIGIAAGDNLQISVNSGTDGDLGSTAKYRDPSAWYHIVVAFDTTQEAAANRVKAYVNGEQVTDWATETYPIQDYQTGVNNTASQTVGSYPSGGYLDGYLAEFYLIDGTALDASSFGETNAATNQWKPIGAKDDLTFGTNGFYQKYSSTELANSFSDSHTTRTSAAKTMTANGNAQTDTSVKKFGSASYECAATGDFLSTPDSDDFNFGSGDFTISAWLYRTGTSSYQTIVSHKTDNSNYWQWRYFGSGGNITFSVTGTGAFTVSFGCTDSTFPVNTWVHHEIVRDGNSWYLFQNGTQAGSTQTQSASIPNMSGLFELQGGSWLSQPFVGFMDEFHVSKGIARHTSNFSAPTTPDAGDANTVLLLHMNGANAGTSFPDDVNHTITANGDVANSRAQNKVGSSSIKFDGTGDYLSVADSSDWTLGSNFTVETWVRFASTSSDLTLLNHWKGNGVAAAWTLQLGGGNTVKFFYSTDGVNGAGNSSWSWTPSLNTWYHVAVVRDGSDLELYIDGTQTGSTYDISSSTIANIAWPLEIGY